ncbi:hypothetical protein MA16_Dca005418 [Dendrobium catenatum]|uniref:Uncharacterized protein n=1 Tax=Dendrobium catenatum TaxID=906689 RepID=A0A2I0X3C8_9ASPA|nr:hypothetical protein MA16_Dca005418 [Dendrobium catenatum]
MLSPPAHPTKHAASPSQSRPLHAYAGSQARQPAQARQPDCAHCPPESASKPHVPAARAPACLTVFHGFSVLFFLSVAMHCIVYDYFDERNDSLKQIPKLDPKFSMVLPRPDASGIHPDPDMTNGQSASQAAPVNSSAPVLGKGMRSWTSRSVSDLRLVISEGSCKGPESFVIPLSGSGNSENKFYSENSVYLFYSDALSSKRDIRGQNPLRFCLCQGREA